VHELTRNVRVWPLADLPSTRTDGRSLGQSGSDTRRYDPLFDPERTFRATALRLHTAIVGALHWPLDAVCRDPS
jgi:hypothetical protein